MPIFTFQSFDSSRHFECIKQIFWWFAWTDFSRSQTPRVRFDWFRWWNHQGRCWFLLYWQHFSDWRECGKIFGDRVRLWDRFAGSQMPSILLCKSECEKFSRGWIISIYSKSPIISIYFRCFTSFAASERRFRSIFRSNEHRIRKTNCKPISGHWWTVDEWYFLCVLTIQRRGRPQLLFS